MEQVAFKIAAISICLNLAVGLILYITTAGNTTNSFTATNGLTYDSAYTTAYQTDIESSISGAPVENKANAGEKILDFFTLGLYSSAKGIIQKTIYALPTMLVNTGVIDTVLAGIINVLLTVVYSAGLYEMFTGKNILG